MNKANKVLLAIAVGVFLLMLAAGCIPNNQQPIIITDISTSGVKSLGCLYTTNQGNEFNDRCGAFNVGDTVQIKPR